MNPFTPTRHIAKTRIAGIPCEVKYTYFPPSPDIPPAHSHGGLPGDKEDVEIDSVLDRKGYKALWLERKLDDLTNKEYEELRTSLIVQAKEHLNNGRCYV